MPSVAYSIALIARGTGAYAYSYLGPPGLTRGQLVLVSFRSVLEIGLLLHEDQCPPQDSTLLTCIPLEAPGYPCFGAVLADIAELCCSGPDEVAGHLLFDTPASALRLSLTPGEAAELRDLLLADEEATLLARSKPVRGRLSGDKLLAEFSRLSGVLTPGRRRALLRAAGWPLLTRLAQTGAINFSLGFAGTPEVMRRHSAWPQLFQLDAAGAAALGLPAEPQVLPGSYLAGLQNPPPLNSLPRVKDLTSIADAAVPKQASGAAADAATLAWDSLNWDSRWDLPQRWPQIERLGLRRCQSAWPLLESGLLPAELTRALAAGQRVLLLAPMGWMLDRLWPRLLPLAPCVLRHRSDAGALLTAQLLRQIAAAGGGVLVAGSAGAWKLAAWQRFDRIILLDPSHPVYEPQGEPWLDPRAALLLAAARLAQGAGTEAGADRAAQVDVLELSLSALDARCPVPEVRLLPHLPDGGRLEELAAPPALLYFNRLGGGRELSCSECHAAVACPACGGRQVYFRPARRSYFCPSCEWSAADLRCPRCGLQNLAAASPGLEALSMPPGAVLVRGADASGPGGYPPAAAGAPYLYGTARLLEPPQPYIRRNVIYMQTEAHSGVLSDWPAALDNALRLALLYRDPQDAEAPAPLLIGTALYEQLGGIPEAEPAIPPTAPYLSQAAGESTAARPAILSAAQLAALLQAELKLRRLSGLPPYGCVYQLRARSLSREALETGRELLGQRLQADAATSLLRLGRVYSAGLEGGKRVQRFGGWLINARLGHAELQELRWQLHQHGAGLQYRPLRGPWL